MLDISPTLTIDAAEIQLSFVRASGPGGQNINKVSTAVQLRFDVNNSPSLPMDVKERLIRLAGRRITEEGILIIVARRYRAQEQNRLDAVQRFIELVRKAQEKPLQRKATRPGVAAKEARLVEKKRRAEVKRGRRQVQEDLE